MTISFAAAEYIRRSGIIPAQSAEEARASAQSLGVRLSGPIPPERLDQVNVLVAMLSVLEAKGISLPEEITLAETGRGFPYDARIPAMYSGPGTRFTVNLACPYWQDPEQGARVAWKARDSSTKWPEHVILHEMGHAWHASHQKAGLSGTWANSADPRFVSKHLSTFAGSGVGEFVAEYYARYLTKPRTTDPMLRALVNRYVGDVPESDHL